MGKAAVIDADLIGRSRHRFPNLACMKLSAWHKGQCKFCVNQNYDRVCIHSPLISMS